MAFRVSKLIKKIIAQLKGFIPQKISNRTVLGLLKGEARIEAWMNHNLWKNLPSRIFKARILMPFPVITATSIEQHKIHNLDILRNGTPQKEGDNKVIYNTGAYIENQKEWGNVKFGTSDMAYSGCEIMATYNALVALGEPVSEQTVADLIAKYESNGAVLGGKFGSSPYAIEEYFRTHGYDVATTTSRDTAAINKIGKRSDTIIVYAYNDKDDITAQIHTVSITKEKDGSYSVHNAFHHVQNNKNTDTINGYAPKEGFRTLQEAINAISKNPASIDVIGISKFL